MATDLTFQSFSGAALLPQIDALGGLRITVFREFPYLYEGKLEYERDYLNVYVNCPRSLVVLAFDGPQAVGATTCLPLSDEGPEFQAPFLQNDLNVAEYCYFGESILLPEYRGRGVGREFMRRREAHARSLGAKFSTFCAVDRPVDHPLRPANYLPLDAFWQRWGYEKQPHLKTSFSWQEIGETSESPKQMTFWVKPLN